MRLQSVPLAAAGLLLASAPSPGQTAAPGRLSLTPSVRRLDAPVRIARGPGGELLVTDYELHHVCVVGPDGKKILRSFPVALQPSALGVLGQRVFVGSETARLVQVHNLRGRLEGTLGGPGFVIGDPRDLAVDVQRRRVFVVDGAALEIKVFDLSSALGQLAATISGPGVAWSNLQNPTGIALDETAQEVLVADFGTLNSTVPPRVMVFGYDGSSHGWISGKGGPTGQYFARPQGLWLGSSGHLFVVDSWRGEVVVMDRASQTQVAVLGGYGKKPGQLLLPLDLTVLGPNEDLYVTSTSSHRVERFAAGGQL